MEECMMNGKKKIINTTSSIPTAFGIVGALLAVFTTGMICGVILQYTLGCGA